MKDPERVIIFDTTLRDGEQSPGATLTSDEKLEVAQALSRLGVDVIEAGFPAASPDDWQAVHRIAKEVGVRSPENRPSSSPPVICALARASASDIESAWHAIRAAKHPRIHTFLATSPIHMRHKLRMSPTEVLARVREMVGFAKSFCNDIEFSAEDAARSDVPFLVDVFIAAAQAGATTINVPDTVGYSTPEEFSSLVRSVRDALPPDVVVSVHCHNDLGMATANSLAALHAGARQVEVTINGIGERAGNTALEEVVMALYTRKPLFSLATGIDTTQIARVSRLVSSRTGIVVQPNKAIVGANAFAHEAGIHQDGMLKNEQTYEIIRPEVVGVSASQLVLGKHSGRHALASKLAELGHVLSPEALDMAFARFKLLCDKKKQITLADLEALVADETGKSEDLYALQALLVGCGTQGMPTATVRVRGPNGEEHIRAAVGTGPVDAAFKAIDEIIALDCKLVEYSVSSVTEGIDALGEVNVRLTSERISKMLNAQRENGFARAYHGHGADTDILVASAKAYISALNKLLAAGAAVGENTVGEKASGDITVGDQAAAPAKAAPASQRRKDISSPSLA